MEDADSRKQAEEDAQKQAEFKRLAKHYKDTGGEEGDENDSFLREPVPRLFRNG